MNDGMNKQNQVFINSASSEKRVDLANTEEKRIGSMASAIMLDYAAVNATASAAARTATNATANAPSNKAAFAAAGATTSAPVRAAVYSSAYMPTYVPIPKTLVFDEEFYEVFSEIRLP